MFQSNDIGIVDKNFLKLVFEEEDQWKEEQETKEFPEEKFTRIDAGTKVHGNISTNDSLMEILGEVSGNVECKGRVVVKGEVGGDITASDINIISKQRLTGNLSSRSLKIESGVKVVGNITAETIYIAGAVKGDIDAEENLEVSSEAVIYGNIRAKSLLIRPGAVIEGHIFSDKAEDEIEKIFEKD